MPEVHTTAAIVSVGDELTLGQTLDTNSRWLSEQLASVGIIPIEHVTVADDALRQAAALARLADSVDLIVCTGGLGPTADDLTRQALASAMGDSLEEDPIALAQVESWFLGRGREMPPINRVQALRPKRAATMPNLNGTAPGIHAVLAGAASEGGHRECDVFCLPGPPGEMKPMFEAQVLGRLRPPGNRCVRTRALHCIGLGESVIASRLGEMMSRDRVPLVGTTASGGIVSVRIRYEGHASVDEADQILDGVERDIRTRLGANVFGSGAETLAHAVVHRLRALGQTLAIAESCTGGRLGAMITDVPGSSAVLVAGWITYSNDSKQRDLGLKPSIFEKGGPGAVSSDTVEGMARGALERSGATHALAITGIAGPDGGTHDKPVGTVYVALATRDGLGPSSDARRFLMAGDRHSIREWSATSALAMLWIRLNGAAHAPLLRQVERFVGA